MFCSQNGKSPRWTEQKVKNYLFIAKSELFPEKKVSVKIFLLLLLTTLFLKFSTLGQFKGYSCLSASHRVLMRCSIVAY